VEEIDGGNTPLLYLFEYFGEVFFVESGHFQLAKSQNWINFGATAILNVSLS
jgi:hypothetical protein